MKKQFTILLITAFAMFLIACSKETNPDVVDNTTKTTQEATTKPQGSKITTILDRSKASTDLQNCDNIMMNFVVSLEFPEVWDGVKSELNSLKHVCYEVKSVEGTPKLKCQNSTNMSALTDDVTHYMTTLSEPKLKKDLDGSGIIQSQYYVVITKDKKVSVYISGEGKTLENLLNDTDGDGIYKCAPDICDEYKWN